MSDLNQIVCGFNLTGGNTDVGTCVFNDAPVVGLLLAYGKKFTPAEQEDMAAALAAALIAPNREDRLYPVQNITNAEDLSQERQVQTTGYGDEIVTREKKTKTRWGILKGGLSLHKKLKVHSDVCVNVFEIDSKNRLRGYKDNDGNLCAFDLTQLYVDEPIILTGANLPYINIEPAYADNTQRLARFAWINGDQENISLTTLVGLKDVELVTKVAVTVGGVIKVNGLVGATLANMRTLYGAALANEEAWVLKDKNGATVTTTLADDPATDSYGVTVDNTVWAAAASGDEFTLQLATVAVLQAAPVSLPATVKIESDVITFEKP
jgi:hypothetical protein